MIRCLHCKYWQAPRHACFWVDRTMGLGRLILIFLLGCSREAPR